MSIDQAIKGGSFTMVEKEFDESVETDFGFWLYGIRLFVRLEIKSSFTLSIGCITEYPSIGVDVSVSSQNNLIAAAGAQVLFSEFGFEIDTRLGYSKIGVVPMFNFKDFELKGYWYYELNGIKIDSNLYITYPV